VSNPADTTNEAVESPVSSTQRVYENLRELLIFGDIVPGERLKVDALKLRLGVGASPIREALSLLTSDQLVQRLDQRGFRAAPVDRTNFHEILRLRCQLESSALRASIEKGGAQWEEQLVLAHYRLSVAGRDDVAQWEHQHKHFHMALIKACESPLLLRFCEQLYDLNIRYRMLAGRSITYTARKITDEHERILEAATARNVEVANELLLDHYTRTGEYLAEQLELKSS